MIRKLLNFLGAADALEVAAHAWRTAQPATSGRDRLKEPAAARSYSSTSKESASTSTSRAKGIPILLSSRTRSDLVPPHLTARLRFVHLTNICAGSSSAPRGGGQPRPHGFTGACVCRRPDRPDGGRVVEPDRTVPAPGRVRVPVTAAWRRGRGRRGRRACPGGRKRWSRNTGRHP